MADTNYKDFGSSVGKLIEGSPPLHGTLGYMVRGQYHVIDPDDPNKFLVRFDSGTHVSALHHNTVLQQPDLPVLVSHDNIGRPIITGVDKSRLTGFDPNGDLNPSIGPHTHARGSGRDFIIDTWLLKQLRATVTDTYEITIAEGAYFWDGALHWYGGGTIDLTGTAPTALYEQRWVVIGIDPTTETLVQMSGDSYSAPGIPIYSNISLVEFVQAGYIALCAVSVRQIDSTLANKHIEDLRFLPGALMTYLGNLYNVDPAYDVYGVVLGYDGYMWQGVEGGGGTGGTQTNELLMSIEGLLTTVTNPLKASNQFGTTKVIVEVYLTVGTAPAGDDLIVDILKNGTTIFTNPANRPTIPDGQTMGGTTSIDVPTWADGDYLEVEVAQVGTSVPGSDLVAHVVFRGGAPTAPDIVALDDLSDVDATGGSTGDVLTQQSDGSFALEAPAGGALALDDLTDVVATGGSTGDVLTQQSDGSFALEAPSSGGGSAIGFAPQGFIIGFEVSCDATNVFIAPGVARVDTDDYDVKKTTTITIDPTTTGANGLDAGSLANSTWYYVYVIVKSSDDTTAGLLSTSASPTLPSGYDLKRRVGMVRTDGSAVLYRQYTQPGGGCQREVLYDEVTDAAPFQVLTNANISTYTTFTDVDCSAVVPPTSRMARIFVVTLAAVNNSYYWREKGLSAQKISAGRSLANDPVQVVIYAPLSTAQVGSIAASGSVTDGIYLRVEGYYDNLTPTIV